MLIVFSGLPGTGKTTIAKHFVTRMSATYLRVDTIEQAIRNAKVLSRDVERSGYWVASELALSNLYLGNTVVVDCVNPVTESRSMWREIAARSGTALLNIQVTCSDKKEHRRRVESRKSDVPGLVLPTWQSILEHEYEPWDDAPLTINTAFMPPEEAAGLIAAQVIVQRSGSR